jgi:hypothetical protein
MPATTDEMTAARAVTAIGGCGTLSMLANMKLALSFHSWSNTAEENERLDACKWLFANARNRRAFLAEKQRRHDARFARKA